MKLHYQTIFKNDQAFHIGNTFFNNNEKTYKHHHNFYEIFYLIQGSIKQFINKQVYRVEKGQFCFVRPGDVHFFQKVKSEKSAIMTNIAFTKELFIDTLRYLFENDKAANIVFPEKPVEIERSAMKNILAEANILLEQYAIQQKTQLINLKRLLVNIFSVIYQHTDTKNLSIPIWLEKAMLEMHKPENFRQGLQKFIVISERTQEHLTRVIKKHLKTTPTEFINKLRLQYVARQLLSSDKSVTEIMYNSGFQSNAHFNKLFRERFSCTPSQYRKNNNYIISPV